MFRVLACAAALLSASAFAQADKPAGTSVSAVWLSGQAGKTGELLVAAGDKAPQPLAVGRTNRGRAVMVELGSSSAVRLLAPAKANDGSPSLVPVGEIALPAGARPGAVVLVLVSSPDNRVRGVALADDPESFPVGTVRVVNFTSDPLLMRLDQQVKTLSPGPSAPFPYAKLGDPKQAVVPSFPFALARAETVFFNGRIDAWPGSRTLVLVAPSTAQNRPPTVQSLIDQPAPPKPAKVAAR